jgi:hypothetical protein
MLSWSVLSFVHWAQGRHIAIVCLLALTAILSMAFQKIFYRLWLHPLAAFRGPNAPALTVNWKAFVECVLNRSFTTVLEELHVEYGMSCFMNQYRPKLRS